MSTDRELLELAAKAIGRTITGWNRQRAGAEVAVLDDGSYWQPLLENGITDCDGDAMRLANRLNISVQQNLVHVSVSEIKLTLAGIFLKEDMIYQEQDIATRRAIVRAAAEIGRRMS